MADDDELLRHALAVAGPTLAAQITRVIGSQRQFPAAFNGGSFNREFARSYIGTVQQALRAEVEQQLRDANGDLSDEQIALALASTNIATDPELNAAVTQFLEDEAKNWPPGTESARDVSFSTQIIREMVRQKPGVLQAVIDAVHEAREARIRAEPAPGNQLLRPVPPQGDVLARELSPVGRTLGLRMLRGFLGGSEVPGTRRLYRTLEFNEYLDIPVEAIIQTLDLRTPFNPVGGSLIWVTVGARLIHGTVSYTRPELEGRLMPHGLSTTWDSGAWMGGRADNWGDPHADNWGDPHAGSH